LPFSCEVSPLKESQTGAFTRKRRTLQKAISTEGVALFTGEHVSLSLVPAGASTGIVFERTDLPGSPELPACADSVQATPRCTILASGQVTIQTVEHLLAALRAYQIDDVRIQVSGSEIPIFDGSALPFVELIEKAGIAEQEESVEYFKLSTPLFWSQGDIHLVALPAEKYQISYTAHYPHSKAIGTQFYSFTVEQEGFSQEIAPCRTFSIYEEIAPMIDKGLLKGGSLKSAVVVKGGQIANPEGLRYSDEMVRHKILDLIGDLSLLPPFLAHVIAVRSGHSSNNAFAKVLLNHMKESM